MVSKIPVTVIVTTKNEEQNIARCLGALTDFDEVIVLDSDSQDKTCEIAETCGARIENFQWNGSYPKKRQWALDNLAIKNDWVFWVDADEVLTPECTEEIRQKFASVIENPGFFVSGLYVWHGSILHHGMRNNKIALIDKRKMEFPVVNDLHIEGMGEMEGHYQPVLKPVCKNKMIGQIKAPLLHFANEDKDSWERRHQRYASWEAEMTHRECWPEDPVPQREFLKQTIRRSKFRPQIMFLYSYIFKKGFLDGSAGWDFAKSRARYCHMIRSRMNNHNKL